MLLVLHSATFAKKISTIPEASGICYSKSSQTLFVVSDRGIIYELSTSGKILRKKELGLYDLEGIDYDENTDKLYLADEYLNQILILNPKNFEIIQKVSIKKKYKKKKIFKYSFNKGIEAIAIDNGKIYLSNQSDEKWPNKNASIIFQVKIKETKAKIINIFNHEYFDVAGLTFHQGYMFFVSDAADILVKYDYINNKTVATYKLPGKDQEGVCFDNENIYIADDSGAVLKFSKKELKIQ